MKHSTEKIIRSTMILSAISLLAVLIWWLFFTNSEEEPFYIGGIPITDDTIYGIFSYCILFGFGSLLYFKFGDEQPVNFVEKVFKAAALPVLCLGVFLFFLPIIILPLINALVTVVLWTYYFNNILFVLIIVSLCISILSYVAVIYLLRHTEAYQYIASLRILSLLTAFIFFGLFATTFFSPMTDALTDDENGEFRLYGLILISFIWIALGYVMFNDFHFIVYDKKHYLLYLRSFQFDKNEHTISEPLEVVGIPVLKIGNPKTFFPKGVGDVFYLPSADWKKQLNYYIDRAEYVFSVVDITEGVLWEMFEHLEQYNKFVYHITDKEHLRVILSNAPKQEYKDSFLMKCYETILNDPKIQSCSIHIKDGICYYSDAGTILKLISGQAPISGIPHFTIEDWNLLSARFVGTNVKRDYYKSLDATRWFIRAYKWIVSTIAKIVAKAFESILGFCMVIIPTLAIVLAVMPSAVFRWADVEPWGIGERAGALLVAILWISITKSK